MSLDSHTTKRRIRKKRMCKGKIPYDSLQSARIAAARFTKKMKMITIMNAYTCHCGKFHIGKTKQIDWTKIR